MIPFAFLDKYFRQAIFDDHKNSLRVQVDETPTFNVLEEEYSLRVETRHSDGDDLVHRNYAIEKHQNPPHQFPHLQFKFHTEKIGQFRLRVDLDNQQEYERAILGFIYKIKKVLEDMETYHPGITNEVLYEELVAPLSIEGDFLSQKMMDGYARYGVEIDKRRQQTGSVENMRTNPLLVAFIGEKLLENIGRNEGKED